MRGYDVILTCNYSPWSSYSGGAQKSVHMLAMEMARQGLRVAAVYSKAPWEKIPAHAPVAYEVHWTGFFAFRSGISSPLRFLNGILFYFKVRSLSSPGTALHGHGDEASLLWLIRNRGAFVYTNRYPEFPPFLYGRDWTKARTWAAILFREPRLAAMAMGMRRADAPTVTSAYSRKEAASAFGVDAASIRVVGNGVDPVFLDTPIESAGEGRGVLFFGRLTWAKGADLALEAYSRLPRETREAHPLRFVGAGPLSPELRERCEALGLGGVAFAGWKSGADLAREILSHKVVCLPSREESFGNAVVETLALGRALVSTRAGSIPEVAGPWGRLVESGKAEALAEALAAELDRVPSPEERAAQRDFVRARFSWGRACLEFRKAYRLDRGADPDALGTRAGDRSGLALRPE